MDLYGDTFLPALTEMVKQYNNMVTDTRICSAMHMFGKYTGASRVLQNRRTASKQKAIKRLNLKTSCQIPVQPASTARRNGHMGRGGKRLRSGRPCKGAHVREHGYSQSKGQSSAVLPPSRKRLAALHNLSQNVSVNQSSGITHSTK